MRWHLQNTSVFLLRQLKSIEAVEKGGKTTVEICRENHGIAPSSLSTILKDGEKIRSAVDQGTCQHKKQ